LSELPDFVTISREVFTRCQFSVKLYADTSINFSKFGLKARKKRFSGSTSVGARQFWRNTPPGLGHYMKHKLTSEKHPLRAYPKFKFGAGVFRP
jgi:hypothetical protein